MLKKGERDMYFKEETMNLNTSGSIELAADLADLMLDKAFEQDLISSFTQKRYFLSKDAPQPLWTLCSVSFQMIRLFHSSEIFVIDEQLFDDAKPFELVDCCSGDSVVKIKKSYIETGGWH